VPVGFAVSLRGRGGVGEKRGLENRVALYSKPSARSAKRSKRARSTAYRVCAPALAPETRRPPSQTSACLLAGGARGEQDEALARPWGLAGRAPSGIGAEPWARDGSHAVRRRGATAQAAKRVSRRPIAPPCAPETNRCAIQRGKKAWGRAKALEPWRWPHLVRGPDARAPGETRTIWARSLAAVCCCASTATMMPRPDFRPIRKPSRNPSARNGGRGATNKLPARGGCGARKPRPLARAPSSWSYLPSEAELVAESAGASSIRRLCLRMRLLENVTGKVRSPATDSTAMASPRFRRSAPQVSRISRIPHRLSVRKTFRDPRPWEGSCCP